MVPFHSLQGGGRVLLNYGKDEKECSARQLTCSCMHIIRSCTTMLGRLVCSLAERQTIKSCSSSVKWQRLFCRKQLPVATGRGLWLAE
eukprot:1141935-Pelagomonas_calceolata.AAC.1